MRTFLQLYQPHQDFTNRYIIPEKLFDFLDNYHLLSKEIIGYSTEERPIYRIRWGKGEESKILAWSQMHGNESNATLAFLDFLYAWEKFPLFFEELYNQVSLDFIVMLNPDGAKRWTRLNAVGIDLNRDFHSQKSKELFLLKKIFSQNTYHYALNLHEQRTIFSTDGKHPATLSFLSPSENIERTITSGRKKGMAVIASLVEKLQNYIPHQLARYTDEFYPQAVGDNFMALGVPTILFEGGHFLEDYQRVETRKYYTLALYECLKSIMMLNGREDNWEQYMLIPENQQSHYDIIYRNVTLDTEFPCILDIAVQFKEQVNAQGNGIDFIPYVVEVGNCSDKKGWKEIDCTGKRFVSSLKFPKLDAEVNFSFEKES